MLFRSLWVAVLAAFAFLSLTAPPAMAGKPRTHDRFFLRMAVGGGGFSNKLNGVGADFEYSGFAGDADIAVGGMVSSNLALHGTFFGWAASDPDVKLTPGGSGTANGTATMDAFGGGLTYYFMPSNVYLSGSLGFGSFNFDPQGGSTSNNGDGLALELTGGKEWWVANSWGLGISGAYMFSSVPESGVSDNWKGHSYSVRFSATFN